MKGSSSTFSLLRTIEAEAQAMKYCKYCQTAKPQDGFKGEMCEACQEERPVTLVNDPQENECFRNAVLSLVRAHRAEFDHLIQAERNRVRSEWSEPSSNLSWSYSTTKLDSNRRVAKNKREREAA